MGSLGFQGGQPGIVPQSCASCIGIHELFYEPAIPGAARQPGRIGRCGGRRSGIGRAGPTRTGGRSCTLAATPSSLQFTQIRSPPTYNSHGVAKKWLTERVTLWSVIDSERQPPGADLGGAGDGEHGGADNRPPGRAGLQSVTVLEMNLSAEFILTRCRV